MLYTARSKIVLFVIGTSLLLASLFLFVIQPTGLQAFLRLNAIPPTAFLTEPDGSPIFGVFEGITPCSAANRPLPQIPENTNCEQMIWKLTLYQDPATGSPTTYKLSAAYGLSQQGTKGLQRGGTPLTLEGKWIKTQGTQSSAKAVVYQLNPDNPQESFSFIKLDDNLLHVLTADKRLLVGNAAWSYTLNRTDKRYINNASVPAVPSTAQTTTPQPTDGLVRAGTFEGRIACVDAVKTLFGIAASDSNCQLVKLRLVLQDDNPQPTYEFLNVRVGSGDTRHNLPGTWTILRGTKADPDAVVYKFSPNSSLPSIFMLKADDNHLFFLDSDLNLMVGDAITSYTLSRAR